MQTSGYTSFDLIESQRSAARSDVATFAAASAQTCSCCHIVAQQHPARHCCLLQYVILSHQCFSSLHSDDDDNDDDDRFTDCPLVYSPALPVYLTINARTRPDWRLCCSPPSWWEWCTRCTASCCTASCRSPPPRARSPTAPGSSRWLCKASVSSTVSPCSTSPPSRYSTDKPSSPPPSILRFHFSHVKLPQISCRCSALIWHCSSNLISQCAVY